MTKITIEAVKKLYPHLGDAGLKLTKEYMNLAVLAVRLKLIDESEFQTLEEKYVDVDNMFEKLLNISADILTLLSGMVKNIKIPQDPVEFEKWEKDSVDYQKVVCHDAFVDVFLSANDAICKGFK
jgi:hypothetical protein